jgi:hypothetical protein
MKTRQSLIALLLIGGGVLAGAGLRKVWAEGVPSPDPLYYSGTLTESGKLVSGTRAITVNVWDAESGGDAPLCATVDSSAKLTNGRFRIALDADCADAIAANNNAWVEVIDGATSLGRSKIGAVPYALEANHAVSASHAATADTATEATHAAIAGHATGAAALEAVGSHAGFFDPLNAGPSELALPAQQFTKVAESTIDASGPGLVLALGTAVVAGNSPSSSPVFWLAIAHTGDDANIPSTYLTVPNGYPESFTVHGVFEIASAGTQTFTLTTLATEAGSSRGAHISLLFIPTP